jgi:transketolase C-terminal domain/subunit
LGSAVAEVLAEAGEPDIAFKRVGIPNAFVQVVGDQQYLKQIYSLDADGIATTALAVLERVRVHS